MEPIERTPMGAQAYERILQAILDGIHDPGRCLKDTELAEALGISRTPVREALLRLTQERLLENRPGRGFTVWLMDSRDATETYPILWTLEGGTTSSPRHIERHVSSMAQRLRGYFGRSLGGLGTRPMSS